jgi:Fe-S-cluster-containing hydrogenase component 2
VLGRHVFLFHRHAVISAPEKCTGCLRCVQACAFGVIEASGAPEPGQGRAIRAPGDRPDEGQAPRETRRTC